MPREVGVHAAGNVNSAKAFPSGEPGRAGTPSAHPLSPFRRLTLICIQLPLICSCVLLPLWGLRRISLGCSPLPVGSGNKIKIKIKIEIKVRGRPPSAPRPYRPGRRPYSARRPQAGSSLRPNPFGFRASLGPDGEGQRHRLLRPYRSRRVHRPGAAGALRSPRRSAVSGVCILSAR